MLGKAERVPQFGAKVPVAFDPIFGDFQHTAQGRHLGVRKAQGVGAICVDHVQWVDDVALGLGHFFAFGVAHQLVKVDGLERVLFQHGLGHHHHAGDPEEQDILTGDKNVAGEVFHCLIFGRPAESAERPKAGGEPCVEDVGVAPHRCVKASSIQAPRPIDLPATRISFNLDDFVWRKACALNPNFADLFLRFFKAWGTKLHC